MIEIRVVEFGSQEYHHELKLRNEVLRRPLGLTLSVKEIEGEENHVHIGAFSNANLIGCLVLTPKEENVFQMRQVAVIPSMQGLGIGQKLVLFAEDYAREKTAAVIILQARKSVKNFYEKLGYISYGDEFTEKTILHVKMKKNIK